MRSSRVVRPSDRQCLSRTSSEFNHGSVADPHHLDKDPDPSFHIDVDADPKFHSDEDPNPYNFKAIRIDPDPVPQHRDANLRLLV